MMSSFFELSFFTYLLSFIPWTFVFVLLREYGVRLYILKKKEGCTAIQKNITNWTVTTDGDKGSGYAVGYWYLAQTMNNDEDMPSMWIICSKNTFAKLSLDTAKPCSFQIIDSKESNTLQKEEAKQIFILDRFGSQNSCYYRRRSTHLSVVPRAKQQNVVDEVRLLLKTTKKATILLHGKPGVGKTMVGYILAHALGGSYTSECCPWEPTDCISNIYDEGQISESHPLIIAWDEIDIALEAIQRGIPSSKRFRIKVQNKQGWNNMFDAIHMGHFPHLVILMTTNKRPEELAVDPSFLANHRIDKIIEY